MSNANEVFLKFTKITEMHSGEVNKLHRKNAFHISLHLYQNPIYSKIPAHSNKLQWSGNADIPFSGTEKEKPK